MVTNIWDEIKIIRSIKGGVWWKTKTRGWMRPELYGFYRGYGYDPIFIKEEIYENK